ncbi:MAG: sugar ABC transporter permease [Chloroflexi bacterium]|jgi:ABC-type sugar transport system permease subunit|nr:sugar ABC transporter permease [Chloroflexota bacterium]
MNYAEKRTLQVKLRPYLFIAPAFIFMLFVFAYPIGDLLRRSTNRQYGGEMEYIGLEAFRLTFRDDFFWTSLFNNLRLFLAVPILVVLSLIFATLIFERLPAWRIHRTLVFIPYVMAVPVVGVVFTYILTLNGVMNTILERVGLDFIALDWLGSSKTAIWAIMAVIIWKELGFGIVLFLARMSSISVELYDAAKLDGASWWQEMRHVTIPQTATVIEFYVVISMITMLSWVFAYILVMTKGGPGGSTWVMEYYIYQKAFQYSQMHIAAAASVLLLVFAGVLMVVQGRLRRELGGLDG